MKVEVTYFTFDDGQNSREFDNITDGLNWVAEDLFEPDLIGRIDLKVTYKDGHVEELTHNGYQKACMILMDLENRERKENKS